MLGNRYKLILAVMATGHGDDRLSMLGLNLFLGYFFVARIVLLLSATECFPKPKRTSVPLSGIFSNTTASGTCLTYSKSNVRTDYYV